MHTHTRTHAHALTHMLMHTHTRSCTRIHAHVRAHAHAHTCTRAHAHTHTHSCTCSCTRTHAHARARMLMHTHAHALVHMLMHTHVLMHILMHTRSHTLTCTHGGVDTSQQRPTPAPGAVPFARREAVEEGEKQTDRLGRRPQEDSWRDPTPEGAPGKGAAGTSRPRCQGQRHWPPLDAFSSVRDLC